MYAWASGNRTYLSSISGGVAKKPQLRMGKAQNIVKDQLDL